MSNWAKLQQDLTGLPVAKRARHGIHFQKGSEIEAHFVGKPCHFQENGIWKPIDTALLATADGWYSSPHSDVVIHPDGRVRVKNSDYQKFTELPSAKAGKLVGDKIIREFPGGEQWLIMKEDGFREEIHVNKQKIPVEKFIAKSTGNLPSKYKAHPITAEDAEGNSYTFTGDVKAFGAWLDKAVYPVVIDPDFSTTSSAGDTSVNNAVVGVGKNYGASTYLRTYYNAIAQKILIRFDCSSIAAGTDVTAAILDLYKYDAATALGASTLSSYGIAAANGDWIEGTKNEATAGAGEPCWNAKEADGSGGITTKWAGDAAGDGGSDAGCSVAGTDYINTVLGTASINGANAQYTKYTMIFNADGITCIEGWLGVTNTNYGLMIKANTWTYGFCSSEHATESYRPVLTVTYTAGGVPKHFMHYQRLRSL